MFTMAGPWVWSSHNPLNLGGGVSEIPYFTVFFGGAPPKFRGESSPPKFRGYGLTGFALGRH